MTNLPFNGNFKLTTPYGKKGNWSAGYHTGVDLVGISSTNVYNVCNGKVIMAKNYGAYGNCVKVQDNETKNIYLFAHLKSIAVRVGQTLSRTSKIGVMGNTGNSYGAHLHFEVRTPQDIYGKQYNPCDYLGIPNKVGQYNSNDYQIDNPKYNTGDSIEINTPMLFTGSVQGAEKMYDTTAEPTWLNENTAGLVSDNKLHARATFLFDEGNIVGVQVYEDQFKIFKKYIIKKL